MKRSFGIFSRVFMRSMAPQKINKNWIHLAKATLLASLYHQYSLYTQKQAECSIFHTNKFNYHTAAKSNIVIYRHNKDEPVAAGIIIDENGLCISISNIYPRISEDKLDMNSFYAKVLGDDHTYALNFIEYLNDDNIVIFKLVRRDPDIRFQPAKFTNESTIGSNVYAIGKSHLDFSLIESGLINETAFNAKTAFGKENDTNSFNLMANIPNRNTTLFGGPLYDETGAVLGMIIPYDDKILPTHILATPYSFLEGIIKQYKENGRVRRPYLGMSIKSAGSGNGAFVIKISSDSPAHQVGIKLGDTIVEINDQSITNNNDFFKCLGYNIGQDLKFKLERDGKYRVVHIKSS